jgi:hypothetical protein
MEIFFSAKSLRVLAEHWRIHLNTVRPNRPPGYKPVTPVAWLTEAP